MNLPEFLDSGVNAVLEVAARGFRAWFILQHYFGYRPFITVLERDFDVSAGGTE